MQCYRLIQMIGMITDQWSNDLRRTLADLLSVLPFANHIHSSTISDVLSLWLYGMLLLCWCVINSAGLHLIIIIIIIIIINIVIITHWLLLLYLSIGYQQLGTLSLHLLSSLHFIFPPSIHCVSTLPLPSASLSPLPYLSLHMPLLSNPARGFRVMYVPVPQHGR